MRKIIVLRKMKNDKDCQDHDVEDDCIDEEKCINGPADDGCVKM